MRGQITSVLLTILILVSTSSVAFITKPSLAEGDTFRRNSGGLLETNTPNKPSKLSQAKDSANKTDSLDKKLNTPQEKRPENQSQPSPSTEDAWNLNNTNEWKKDAYLDGNKTRLIVGINSEKPTNTFELDRLAIKHQAKIVNDVSIGNKTRAAVVEIPLASVTGFVEDVRGLGLASYIEPNMKVQAQFVPNDPYWNMQWGPQKIEADWAWNTTTGNHGILVAVIDTGVDYNHPDIAPNYAPLGYDWVNLDPDPIDDCGHGTHCAGIIAAVTNNNVGIAGIAQVHIMAEKVLNYMGGGYWDWVANGIVHAVNQGAKIISMSLGGYGDSELLHDAVKYADDSGVLVVAAAGNDNTNMRSYPAAYEEAIAVAATDQYDNTAWFSNWGDWIELAAPGVDIYSTMPTYPVFLNGLGYSMNYSLMSGTSMACPHVAGVAALIWSLYPDKVGDWLRLWLRQCVDDLGDPGFDQYYGYGRVNARKAIEETPLAHELVAYVWNTPSYVEPGGSGTVNFTILNFGENNETDVAVQLLANDTIASSVAISFIDAGHLATASLTWSPAVEGSYNVTAYVVPVSGEISVENNVIWKYIYAGFPLKAVVLHSAGNVDGDTITNWQVLNTEWQMFGDKMIHIDYTSLNKDDITYADIAATEADVLIISCAYDPIAGWQFTDSEIEAIERYVHEGHGLIATAGTLYNGVPNNNKLAPLFGLNETISWASTGTDLMHLVNKTHPIFAGVPNPFVFLGVGTSLPSDGRWDSNEIADGKYLALGHYQESAIVMCKGLVFISPWLEVIPPYYHHHLQLLYNAITWSRYQKPEHELSVSLKVPKHVNPSEPTTLNATVSNLGRNNETNVELRLFIDGMLVDSATILELSAGSSYVLSCLWNSTVQGLYNVTAYAPPVSGEEFIVNNVVEKTIMVLLLTVKSILVYTDDAEVTPSSRYVIVALDDLGVNYTHYADNPSGFGQALASQPWDVVIVDHCDYYSMGNYWTELENYVLNGGMLLISTFDIDGSNSEQTALWNTLGARWASDMLSPEPVYQWIPSHSMFTFPNTVGNLTSYIEGYSDDGDHVAATTGTPIAGFKTSSTEGYAAIVQGNIYSTVLFSFILDEFRYDQNHDGRLDAVELWQNAIVYLAKGYEHDLAVALDTPTLLQPGETVMLNSTVRNRGLSNETNVELQLLINGTVVHSELILNLPTGSRYELSCLWTPTVEGTYNVTTYALPVPGEENVENNMQRKNVKVQVYPDILVVVDDDAISSIQGTSLPEFESALAAAGYDCWVWRESSMSHPDLEFMTKFKLVIWTCGDCWNWAVDLADAHVLEYYLAQGGNLILEGEDIGYNHDSDQFMMNVAHANYQIDNTEAPGLTVTDPTHPITQGLPTTMTWFKDPRYDDGVTPTNGAFEVISYTGTPWTAVTVFDGTATDSGSVVYYAFPIYCLGLPERDKLVINTVNWLLPRQHDLAATLEVPTYMEPGTSSLMTATVYNHGLNNETDVEFRLLINGTVVKSVEIPELLCGASYRINYSWTPTIEGSYNVTAYTPPVLDEETTANNIATEFVNVTMVKHVLFDQTHGTDSIAYYATWITSLAEMGYVVENHTSGSITPRLLGGYDVFVIPQASNSYSADELSAIQSYVFNGGGLLVIGDDDPWIYTDLTGFADINWSSGGTSGTTTDILPHPVTEGVTSVYLDAPIAAMNTTGVAECLVRDSAHSVMLAASEQWRGAVIGFADENSLWDSAISQADNLRLADNMINWLAAPTRHEHDLAVALEASSFLGRGDTTLLNATICNLGLNNETNVELLLIINDTIADSETIDVLLVRESRSTSYSWTPPTYGAYYNITASAQTVPGENFTKNNLVTKIAYVSVYERTYLPHKWVGGGTPMDWHADDDSWFYVLPFDFPFYGTFYRTIYVSSNGLITFVSSDPSPSNGISELAGKPAIAPAWDDWVTYSPNDIYIWHDSTHVGIQWYVKHLGTNISADFEAILSLDGVIQFNYDYSSGQVSATVGISNGAGDLLAEDLANINLIHTIRFVPLQIEHDVAVTNVAPSTNETLSGNTVNVDVVVENQGNAAESFTVTAFASSELNITAANRAFSSSSTIIYFDPPSYIFDAGEVSIGHRFNVTVNVADAIDLAAWQVSIVYNDAIINVTRWFEPTWDPTYVFYGKATSPTPQPPKVAYTHLGTSLGKTQIMSMLFPVPPHQTPFGGNGRLCIIEFEVTTIPMGQEALSCSLVIDNEDTCLLNSDGETITDVQKENGYYELTWGGVPPQEVYVIGTTTITDLASSTNLTITFPWNTVGIPPRSYRIWAEASTVPGETDVTDNTYLDGIVKVKKAPVARFWYSPQFPKSGENVIFNASESTPDGGMITSYIWSFGDGSLTTTTDSIMTHVYASSGLFNVTMTITDSDGLDDTTWQMIYVFIRDIAIIDVRPSTDQTYVGRTIAIDVTVVNKGEVVETFNVTLYFNITAVDIVGIQEVPDLPPGENVTLTFTWNTNGVKLGIHTVTGVAAPLLGETELSDNTMSTLVHVKMLGDVNGDGNVDIKDYYQVARAYGEWVGRPRWDPLADINDDGQVDLRDLYIVARNYGKSEL